MTNEATCPAHGATTNAETAAKHRGQPPGPRGIPGVGVLPWLARDPFGYLPSLAKRYGDVVTVPLPGKSLILVSHPDHINHVFNKNTSRYHHTIDAVKDGTLPDRSRALPLREGDDWKRVRKVLTPPFSGRALAPLAPAVTAAITESLDRWSAFADTGQPIELQPELGVTVMSALARSLFGGVLDRNDIESWVEKAGVHGSFIPRAIVAFAVRDALGERMGSRLISDNAFFLRKGMANFEAMKRKVDELIDARVTEPNDNPDILNLVLGARFDDGTALDRESTRAELIGLLFAGFETTAAVLAWAIALLALYPDQLEAAYAEVDAYGGEPLGYKHHEEMTFLRACFDEAQRLQGAPLNLRVAKEDDEIAGYRIPAGSMVGVSLYGMHRDPRFWTEPDLFHPRRFLDDEVDKYAFMPFGVGPRRCLGMRLAYLEGLTALGTILQRYRFTLPPGYKPEHKYHLSTGLKTLPVVVHSRRP